MFRKTLSFFTLMLLVASVGYAAPDRTGKVDVGFNVSGAIPNDSEVDSAAYLGGSLAYGVTNWFALGAEAGWAQFDESDSGVNIEQNAVPIFGDIILRMPNDSAVQPYGIVGLGVIVWNVDDNVPNVDFDVDTAFAAKFGAGLDWFINNNWIANFEFSYVTSDAEATARNTVTGASVSAEGETDYWMIGGGLKFLFS